MEFTCTRRYTQYCECTKSKRESREKVICPNGKGEEQT